MFFNYNSLLENSIKIENLIDVDKKNVNKIFN